MIWQDVVVRRLLSDGDLAVGLAVAFRIRSDEVIVNQGGSVFEETPSRKVVCDVFNKSEGFRLVISLYTFFDSPREDDPVAVVKEFARVAQTECLLSDDSPNPYTMIHIHPSGEVVSVWLDVDRLDDKGEYHIRE